MTTTPAPTTPVPAAPSRWPLDARLAQLLAWLPARPDHSHADIGSDHAHLPIRLAERWASNSAHGGGEHGAGEHGGGEHGGGEHGAGEHGAGEHGAGRVIAIEVARLPYQRAQANIAAAGGAVELRLGDGFAALAAGEVASVSIAGLGGQTIAAILGRGQQLGRLPARLLLQPNSHHNLLRQWCYHNGFWLRRETLVAGFWSYPVLDFGQAADHPDPAYQGLPLAVALHFGPWLLRARHPLLHSRLQAEERRLAALLKRNPALMAQLALVRQALGFIAPP
jgi:tRNA (adenine22-N1)-methyltransferase